MHALTVLLLVLHIAHATGLRNSMAAAITIWVLVLFARSREMPPLWLPLMGWLMVGTASSIWATDAENTLKAVLTDIIMPAGAFYAAFVGSRQPQVFRTLCAAIVCGTVVTAGFTVVAFLQGMGIPLQGSDRPSLVYYYAGPGVVSTLAVYALPLAVLLATDEDRGARLMGWTALGCILVAGAGTLNRMFWATLVITLAAYGLWMWPRLSLGQRRSFATGLVMAVIATAGITVYLNQVRDVPQAVPGIRLQALGEWSGIVADAPLLGYGLGKKTLRDVGKDKLSRNVTSADANWRSHAHNLLLNITLQVGLVGLSVFLLLIIALARKAYFARDPSRIATGAALIALIAAMLAKNLTDDFMDHAVVVAFWGYAGILVGRLAFRAKIH